MTATTTRSASGALRSVPLPARSTDTTDLQTTLIDVQAQACTTLMELSALANMALLAMESPDFYRHQDRLARFLAAISGKAEVMADLIYDQAYSVGCVDAYPEDYLRRLDAAPAVAFPTTQGGHDAT